MREVKVFEGGQTVTLGKVISVMGRTSTEVEMGLSLHPLKDWRMSETEQEKPAATTASRQGWPVALVHVATEGTIRNV